MKLNQEQKDKFEAHIDERLKEDDDCSACGKNQWSIDDRLYGLWEFGLAESEASRDVGIAPLIILTCGNCGCLRFFHALNVGLDVPGVEMGKPDEADIA